MPDKPQKSRLSIGTWLSIAAFTLSLTGAAGVVMGKFFAPKSVETTLAVIQEKQHHLDWKVEVVRVGQENGNAQVQTLNINMAKLLERFRVTAEPAPATIAAPPEPVKAKRGDSE